MQFFEFEIVIEKEPDDPGYFACSRTLPGCFSNGATMEQTLLNIWEAITLRIETLLAHGDPIPPP